MNKAFISVLKKLNNQICLILFLGLTIGFNILHAQSFPNASFTYTVGNAGTVYFTSTSTNTTNLKFWWYFGDGAQYTGTLQTISHTYTTNGSYAVVLSLVTLTSGAVRDSVTEPVTINNLITDLKQNEIKKGASLKIKSNSNLNYFELEFEKPLKNNFTVYLLDVNGKIVLSQYFLNEENCRINTSNFEPGVYFIKVQSLDFVITKRIIVSPY